MPSCCWTNNKHAAHITCTEVAGTLYWRQTPVALRVGGHVTTLESFDFWVRRFGDHTHRGATNKTPASTKSPKCHHVLENNNKTRLRPLFQDKPCEPVQNLLKKSLGHCRQYQSHQPSLTSGVGTKSTLQGRGEARSNWPKLKARKAERREWGSWEGAVSPPPHQLGGPGSMNFKKRVRNGRSRSPKVVDFGTNRKRVCDFLLVIN